MSADFPLDQNWFHHTLILCYIKKNKQPTCSGCVKMEQICPPQPHPSLLSFLLCAYPLAPFRRAISSSCTCNFMHQKDRSRKRTEILIV